MNKILALLMSLAVVGLVSVQPGCVTSKTTAPNGATTITVNTNNLALDAAVLQSATAIAVSVAIQKDPGAIPALKDASTALTGILTGANTQNTAQLLQTLGASNNPTLAAEITPLIGTASALEQQLINKYGSSVGGQIALAITKAVAAGFAIGLAGH